MKEINSRKVEQNQLQVVFIAISCHLKGFYLCEKHTKIDQSKGKREMRTLKYS